MDLHSLMKFSRPVPRYTSYPTAVQFQSLSVDVARAKWEEFAEADAPLSVYIHIPFCKTMCLFCACSVTLNRKPEKQQDYLDLLLNEIALYRNLFKKKKRLSQLHFGGGTPTNLTKEQLQKLFNALKETFDFDIDAEISIEIDPRTVYADGGEKLIAIRQMGFNRVSFGVQDLDPVVQEAVRRRQSEEMTVTTYKRARELGFDGINVDLIYGLPFQTVEKFSRTVEKLIELQPDRIALFSYAKVPWLKAHQKAIPDETLPSTEEKLSIYLKARELFLKGGYMGIGMDHFSLENDTLAKAFYEKKLIRNFQGYSLPLAKEMLGLGVTSIGYVRGAYVQNLKTIEDYANAISHGRLPVQRGIVLSEDDLMRKWVIEEIMCHFELDKEKFEEKFGKGFDETFLQDREKLEELKEEGLIGDFKKRIYPTELGMIFIRLVASTFDAYLVQKEKTYSNSV